MQLRRYLIRQKTTGRSRASFSFDSMKDELNLLLKHNKSSSVDDKEIISSVNKRKKSKPKLKSCASFDDNISEAGTYVVENDVKDLDSSSEDETKNVDYAKTKNDAKD